MGKRVLVTGGAGFIGSHVCEVFLKHGWTVEILDNLSTGRRGNLRVDVRLHELAVQSPDAARCIHEGAFDAIVHLAAQIDVRKSVADPLSDAGTNILGTLNVLEAVRSAANARCRVVLASTGGALYGEFVTPPNHETYAKDPESPYAIAKLSAEYYMAYYARVHALDTVALRYGNVYGPGQDPHGEAGVVAIFCGRILDGQALTIFGDGLQTRDYVYVKDVASATFSATTGTLPGIERLDSRAFNIGTGLATPVIDLARSLLDIAKVDLGIQYAPNRRGEQQHSSLNVRKAAQILGWKAETDLRTGLQESYRWFEAQRAAAVGR